MMCHPKHGNRWNFPFLADLPDGIQDASIYDSTVMKTSRATAVTVGLLSLLGAVLLACAFAVGCTINPQPLPPGPDPTPQDPGGGGGGDGTGSDKGGGGGDTNGAAGLGGSAEGGAAADGGDGGGVDGGKGDAT
jgi:hypothetical protein